MKYFKRTIFPDTVDLTEDAIYEECHFDAGWFGANNLTADTAGVRVLLLNCRYTDRNKMVYHELERFAIGEISDAELQTARDSYREPPPEPRIVRTITVERS